MVETDKEDQVCALLIPKQEVATALQALQGLRPRWGQLIASGSCSRLKKRKGIHIPDPCDDSDAALRAIELPPPLNEQVAAALAAEQAGTMDSSFPQTLAELLRSGVAVFDVAFRPPLDLEDLHPCPPPDAAWLGSGGALPAPLPAAVDNPTSPTGPVAEAGSYGTKWPTCPGFAPFRFIELFAGIGGFRIALEALGGECVFASELHPTARAVYRENWPGSKDVLVGDIRAVASDRVPPHDVLTGGFPCQPFSALGSQQGLDEDRGRLFLHVCRILRTSRPALALLENVPGLLETDEGKAMDSVLQEIARSGYRVAYRLYNSNTLLPQKRKRVYIVAIRSDLEAACAEFQFPWLPDLGRCLGEVVEVPPPMDELDRLWLSADRWQRLQASDAYQSDPTDFIGPLDMPAAFGSSHIGSRLWCHSAVSRAATNRSLALASSLPKKQMQAALSQRYAFITNLAVIAVGLADAAGKECTLAGGELVSDGWSGKDTGFDYCNTCSCRDGLLGCTKIGCPALSSTEPPTTTTPKTCALTGGEVVHSGWAGKDTGSNYCNQCRCSNGMLACTRMLCAPTTRETVTTTTKRAAVSTMACTLSDGVTKVEAGWSGKDVGSNWCNSCGCQEDGLMMCTAMACIDEDATVQV